MVAVLLVLIVVFIATENDKIDFFLRENWEEVQKVVGVDVDVDDAASLLHDYFYVIAAVASTGCGINIASIGAAARMLGVRVIAYSFLASIAVLGGGGIYIAYATRGDVPKATTWLLYASGAVQALCGVCGIVGFKNLNRECMRWTFIILALSSFGLGYVVVSSYLYLRDNAGIAHPENLLLVFGVSLVSDFFMLSTLVFGGVYYCRQQRAFRRADRRNEVPAQFSNTTTRKYGKRGGRVPREYNARNAL